MSNEERLKFNNGKRIQHSTWVTIYLMIYDVVAVSIAYLFALLLRFDFAFSMIPWIYLRPWEVFTPIYAIICVAVFWRLRLYKSIWRFASFTELQRIIIATAVTSVVHIVGVTIVLNILASNSAYSVTRMPFSYYISGIIVQFVLITAIRFSYRFILLLRSSKDKKEIVPVMVFGAGSAATLTIREIRRNDQLKEDVVCIIDDNPNKWNRDIDGVPIIGIANIIGTIPATS